MNFTKKQQKVLAAYKADPTCVNEEHRLLEAVWLAEGWDNTKSLYWNLQRVSHPESISRARRKLHELGLIKYSEEALERRTQQFEQYLDEFGQPVMRFYD